MRAPNRGIRHKGSSTSKIEAYFLANPDEEMSIKDLMVKLDVKEKAMWTALYRLKSEGLLESVHVVRLRAKGIAGGASAIGGSHDRT